MGAHRGDRGREWLQQDAGEQQQQNPWNIMIKHRQVQRRGRRSQMAVSYTDPVISMDLLRTVLQPSFNDDILAVFKKYMKFFEKAASNVKENVGEDVQTDQLIKDACRNCLEHAKRLFPDAEKTVQRPVFDSSMKRSRQMDDDSSQRGSPIPKKRKGRPPLPTLAYDRNVSYSAPIKPKVAEPIKREGPKYAADAQDKQWLAERQHMRATGGKMAYLLIEEDIQDLASSEEYKDCPELKMDELKPFMVPVWMLEKMQKTMEAQRSEKD
ncbi:Deoxynucleotidyltransferase terminal-interacting protein 1 [Bagarius yarrelli]|uniref:Deoxynucleotidyltransferase terminal-interacting protein 1 n=1 Tax=Bagarius yarrelli TaxID=175774 RepID=A0A556U3K9_BAGYA|nr:Deoxynucleotidyltransferase terminal-interacting protein 1 [Bagarius yarrelli]